MRFLIFLSNILFAITISNVNLKTKEVTLSNYVKKGRSGVVICKYLKTPIICARVISFGKKAKLIEYDNLNDAFAKPIVSPRKGDRVVFAKDYSRILIIAPNQEIYLKVKNIYKNNIIISPDLLAVFLDDKINKSLLIEFAKQFNIGRYIIVWDKIYEVDSFSLCKIDEKNITLKAKYKNAFFTYLNNFNIKPVNYYKLIICEGNK